MLWPRCVSPACQVRSARPLSVPCVRAVFNVSNGREFYGHDGCYRTLAGRDASRWLAKGILEEEEAEEAKRPLSGFEESQLREWHEHFQFKYVLLGALLPAATEPGDVTAAGPRVVDGWREITRRPNF